MMSDHEFCGIWDLRLEEKIYKTIVRLTILYGFKCLIVKKHQIHKVSVAKIRMLRWICEVNRKDRKRYFHS